MKIVTLMDSLVVGGSQINAIEMAAKLRDNYGHDVLFVSGEGPLSALAEQKRLRHVIVTRRESYIRFLRGLVRQERPDVLHVWDPTSLSQPAYYGAYLGMGVPIVNTSMEMEIDDELPKSAPTTFGTPEIEEKARRAGFTKSFVLLPGIDVESNAPHAVDAQAFRDRFGVKQGEITLVTVSRLAKALKNESLKASLEAVLRLGEDYPVRMFLVGDGPERASLQNRADEINHLLGREAITLTGAMLDPRPAYAAADITIGMGGSAMRGLAFEKPTVVVGENGFASTFTPETSSTFFYRGFYGTSSDQPAVEKLTGEIRFLLENTAQHQELGQCGRSFVVEHFSLEAVTANLEGILQKAARNRPQWHSILREAILSNALQWWGNRLLARMRNSAEAIST